MTGRGRRQGAASLLDCQWLYLELSCGAVIRKVLLEEASAPEPRGPGEPRYAYHKAAEALVSVLMTENRPMIQSPWIEARPRG